jgi:N-acetylmuramoyl-L-alanine amidase
VLLELGYLSSEKDLAKLTSPQWRDTASTTTAQAIEAFFATRDKQAQQQQQAASARARPQ